MNETWWVGEDQLDDDQKKIAVLPPKGSHLIMGPPGCGKTNLLLLRAKYYAKLKKENILVLVFTRALQDFIISGSKSYHLPAEIVRTSRRWSHEFLRQHGKRCNPSGTFEQQRDQLLAELQSLIKTEGLSQVYEAIFLDEAQDYLPEEILLFRHIAKEIYASADSRQKIYAGPSSLDTLKGAVNQIHPLRYHYRIGQRVCRLADALNSSSQGDSLLSTSLYNEKQRPSSVEHIACRTVEEQGAEIIKKLEVQLQAYPDELLGVMCPKKDQRDKIYEIIAASPIGKLAVNQSDDPTFEPDKPIYVSTLHSAKGLEYRASHLAYAETIKDFDYHKNMTYTAVTRTKTSLTVYSVGQMSGYLKQALNSLETAPKAPNLNDLFRR
jgi:superfamily I DNA and RNA helicase